MPVVKPISDQTRALTTIQEREDRIQRTIAHGYDDLTNGRVPLETSEGRGGSDASLEISPPPCNHPVNHSGALEFYRDTVAPGAPLC